MVFPYSIRDFLFTILFPVLKTTQKLKLQYSLPFPYVPSVDLHVDSKRQKTKILSKQEIPAPSQDGLTLHD